MFKTRFISMLVLLAAVATGAWAETIDLSTLTADYTAQDGATLTGKVPKNVKISIADGATVTLDGVDISGQEVSIYWGIPGIDCLGDATIILKGENTVSAGRYWEEEDTGYEIEIYWDDATYSGIYVHAGKTLTIKGNGKLTANGGYGGPGIGGAYRKNGGNIEIQGGTIIATGGDRAAGIGGGDNASCGYITITTGVTSVTATKGSYSPNSIGAGYQGSCGTVTIGGTVTGPISTNPYTYEGNPTVAVTGVTLAPTTATLTLGETETVTLIPTVLPGDATDKSVTWSSSNEAVATVADGVVTAVAAGEATITVTTTDGAKTATCAVTVAAPAASTYTVTLKEGTDDATSWTITPEEAKTTGVAAGTEVKASYGGVKKVKSVKAVKKAAAPVPVTYTALSGGEVLHVGDIIEVPDGQEWCINGDYYFSPDYNPFTVVRANITSGLYPWDTTVTEAADGAYYVIKNKDGDLFFTGEDHTLPVTETSDGIYVTYNGISWGYPDYTFSVHEK